MGHKDRRTRRRGCWTGRREAAFSGDEKGIRSARPATGIGHRGHLWSGAFDGCACACLAGQRSCSSRIKRGCACRSGKYGAQWQLWLAGSHLGGRACERAEPISATPRARASPVPPDAPTGHHYWAPPVRHLGTRIYPVFAQCLHADRQLRGCLQRRKERPRAPARSTAQSPSASHPLAFEGERTGGGVSERVGCRTGGIGEVRLGSLDEGSSRYETEAQAGQI